MVALMLLSDAGTLDAAPAPAAGRFLAARADLPDPNFERTVVLLVEAG